MTFRTKAALTAVAVATSVLPMLVATPAHASEICVGHQVGTLPVIGNVDYCAPTPHACVGHQIGTLPVVGNIDVCV